MEAGTISQTVARRTPKGWLECRGQSLIIKDYEELFAAIGTEFGGDGKESFNVPRLSGDARGPRYIICTGKDGRAV